MYDLYLKLRYFLQIIDVIRWHFNMKFSAIVNTFLLVRSIYFNNEFAKFSSQNETIPRAIDLDRSVVKL